jgi:hypothetical protein
VLATSGNPVSSFLIGFVSFIVSFLPAAFSAVFPSFLSRVLVTARQIQQAKSRFVALKA